jgi:hypothetical protein
LPIGRIDLSNMPHFGRDTALVQRYLLKNKSDTKKVIGIKKAASKRSSFLHFFGRLTGLEPATLSATN